MKSILLVFVTIMLYSCSTNENKVATSQVPTKILVPEKIAPPVIENLDLQFNEELNKVWTSYFTEDFTDSKGLVIYVVTNRVLRNHQIGCSDDYFGVSTDQKLRALACKVNVPKNHTTGEINFSLDNRASSHEFFKIINSKILDPDKSLEDLKKSKRIPLVFVHGFNVKFKDALLRASQLAYDLKYQGPVILFTWPAGAGDGFLEDKMINKTYKKNTKTAEESVSSFKNFLGMLSKNNIKVNVVVHSMGHQVVLPALHQWFDENKNLADRKIVNELILNAPDFESTKFNEYLENLNLISKRITLYCSYNDNAMVASEVFNKTKRLGACAPIDNVDTINVSLIDSPTMGIGGLGHGYYASRPIITDVFQVLLGLDAEKRLFIKKSEPNSTEKYFLRP